ncbi:DUF2322 family protein [Caviibacterium pharyngocola]|uniref:DUF2322 domain-containing protein n=1 Tax=Caviibacterium pharyngocola TaxID=28159 RepID=A0A2M8RXF4_9PAST|nr:DUF2322 family protein [Caviibacterium pharyngocola]PJG83566.1 DUF2322 domain-containing protein [Caviibacterium pharyngocola]
MDFKTILETLPTIDHLSGLNVIKGDKIIHHIPAIQGKLGSLRVYNALAQEFNGKFDRTRAERGLQLFAEHTQDARENPAKHPNIDLLLQVIEQGLEYQLVPIHR